jgi:hypothetical protein
MEMMLFCLVLAYVIKNGAVDALEAAHGRAPSRYVAAQKRADARAARARSRAAKYQARTGRPPRRSTVRPYLRQLWHDAVEDAHTRHDTRRAARLSAPVAERSNVRVVRPDDVPAPTVKPKQATTAAEADSVTAPAAHEYAAEESIVSTRWPDTTGHITNTIEPGAEGNEDGTEPRLFAHWDGTHFEDEVEPDEIAPRPTDDPSPTDTPSTQDGDQLATVTPITEGIKPMTATTTEVTGISTAIEWATDTGAGCTEQVTTTERVAAFFASNEFDELAAKAAQMQERFSSLAADCEEIKTELQRFLSVKEQWATVDNQGTKDAIVNE